MSKMTEQSSSNSDAPLTTTVATLLADQGECEQKPKKIGYHDVDQFYPSDEELEEQRKIDELAQLREIAQEFVDRVERGEVRSTYTYQRFKDVLSTKDGE